KLADDCANRALSDREGGGLAKSFPLPVENDESRPRIDLVVFIINLTSELSFQSAEASLKYLEPGYFLGKVCFMVSNVGKL
uniref:Centromere protein M n=1 Tax=Oryzias melastigma TaxID=30732 RepID=A0A3B3DMW8_ORYME